MTLHLRFLFVMLVTLALVSCGADTMRPPTESPTEPPTNSPSIKGNNSALLTGPTLGSGSASVGALRKEVSKVVSDAPPGLSFGTAYATRTSTTSETLYWVLPVTNTSGEALCFIRFNGITFSDGAGNTLAEDDFSYVTGSVGAFSSDMYTDTCLAPGETGYVLGIELSNPNPVYTSLDRISIAEVVADSDATVPPVSIVPQLYTAFGENLNVTVENKGTRTGYVTDFSSYLLLDAGGGPLAWGFLDRATGWEGALAVGERKGLIDPVRYNGSAQRVRVFVDFEATPQEQATSSASRLEDQARRLQRRDEREAEHDGYER